MDAVGKPRGLIRYSSRDALAGKKPRFVRPRTIIYPAALCLALGLFAWQLNARAAADITLLRATDAPFQVDAAGMVTNQVRLRIANRTQRDRSYRIEVLGAGNGSIVVPVNPLPVARSHTETTSLFITLDRGQFINGRYPIRLRIADGAGFVKELTHQLLGPSATLSRRSTSR
jgi:polyferredoxin